MSYGQLSTSAVSIATSTTGGISLSPGYVFGFTERGSKTHIAKDPAPNGRFICSQPIYSRTNVRTSFPLHVCAMCRLKAGLDA